MSQIMKRYLFESGWRRVTVKAVSLEKARERAAGALDERIMRSGGEPPVAYSLQLISIMDMPAKRSPEPRAKCYPRKQFPTKEAAATAASVIYQRNKQHRLPYPCSECRKWHLSAAPLSAIHTKSVFKSTRSTPI